MRFQEMKWFGFIFLFLSLTVVVFLNGCCPPFCSEETDTLGELGEAIRDDDNDGWFTNDTNQKVTLRLATVTWPRNGNFRIIVDGVRFPLDDDLSGIVMVDTSSSNLNIPVAQRTVGTWLLQATDQLISFTSSIELQALEPGGTRVSGTINWKNREEQLNIEIPSEIGSFYLTFRTEIEKFADPAPQNADGDSDEDDIGDQWEAALAERGVGIGDPASKDILLVVGYTHPRWEMTSQSEQLLRTRFWQHDINLYIAANSNCPISLLSPGRMSPQDAFVNEDFALDLDSVVDDIRPKYIRGHCFEYAHLLVLAKEIPPPPGMNIVFGFSDPTRMSKNIVVRSHLFPPILGPEVQDYQAKTIMHELGHNLNLTHPADAGSSVMGTPATDWDNSDIIGMLTNAWRRPMDYSSSEWGSLSLIP